MGIVHTVKKSVEFAHGGDRFSAFVFSKMVKGSKAERCIFRKGLVQVLPKTPYSVLAIGIVIRYWRPSRSGKSER